MRPFRPHLPALALTAAMATVALSPAHAWEAADVAARLKASLDSKEMALSWDSAEKDGSSVVLSGVKVGRGEKSTPVGDVTLKDVGEEDDSYTVGSVDIPDYRAEDKEGAIEVKDISVTGLALPKSDQGSEVLHYRTAGLGSVVVTDKEDRQVFAMKGLRAEMQPPPDDGTLSFTGAADSFDIDLAAMTEKERQKKTLDKLGYSQLSGKASLAGSWRPSDGHLKLSKYSLTIGDAGTLDAGLDISGYTKEFIASMREAGEQMKDAKGDRKSAQGLAMLGLLQQLTFNGLSFRFEDDGLTDKALQLAADRQGTEPKRIADQIKGVIPLRLTELLGPELTQEITKAVGDFLDDPQNIEVSAKPSSPLPFAILVGAAMTAPQTLAQTLGLKVTANR